MKALAQRRMAEARRCIEEGADINYKNQLDVSVLELTTLCLKTWEREEFVIELIQKRVNFNNRTRCGQTEIMLIVHEGILPYNFIADIIDEIEDIHELSVLTGGSYLHMLSSRPEDTGRMNLIEKLLEKGLSINATDNNGDTPLHVMADIACPKTLLIDNGADIMATNRHGENALHSLASSTESGAFPNV